MKTATEVERQRLLLGAHTSTSGGVGEAISRATEIGCTAMQIFVKNNMQWFAKKPLSEEELAEWHEHPRRSELSAVFGHSGYMINMAASDAEVLEKSRRALREELERATQLGLPFLVVHPGAHTGAGEAAGIARVIETLEIVLGELPEQGARVALEITAGQGTCLGSRFEHLAEILEHSRQRDRLAVCFDTAHAYAAGYDLGSEEHAANVFEEFGRVIGYDLLVALHLNDSKAALGSRVDRHEHIGAGKIGLGAFRYIMNMERVATVPKVLETPKGADMREDVDNMARLRQLVRGGVGESM